MDKLHRIAKQIVTSAKDLNFLVEMEASLTAAGDVTVVSSGLVGYVKASFKKIKSAFGQPQNYDPDTKEKTRIKWAFKINNDPNMVFTIYDYKDKKTPIEELKEFHVGVKGRKTKDLIKKIFDQKKIKFTEI